MNHIDREGDNENTSNISRKIATFFLFDGKFLYSFQLALKYSTPKGKSPKPTASITIPIPKVLIVSSPPCISYCPYFIVSHKVGI